MITAPPQPSDRVHRAARRSSLNYESKVQTVLKRLKAANETARSSGQVADRYDYLRRVYRLSGQFADHAYVARIARILAGGDDPDEHDRVWFIYRVIRLTSEDDRRLRSKYVAALTYASVHKVNSSEVVGFIEGKADQRLCGAPASPSPQGSPMPVRTARMALTRPCRPGFMSAGSRQRQELRRVAAR